MCRFNYMLVVCLMAIHSTVYAMDCPEDDTLLLGIKKSHPVKQWDSQERLEPEADTDVVPDGIPVDQADLERKLLDNTDYLLRWTVAQKVTLVAVIVVGCGALGIGGYLLYDKLHPVKPVDEQQDQQQVNQSAAGVSDEKS